MASRLQRGRSLETVRLKWRMGGGSGGLDWGDGGGRARVLVKRVRRGRREKGKADMKIEENGKGIVI